MKIRNALPFFVVIFLVTAGLADDEKLKTKPPVSVLLFVSTDCPIANRYAPEINRIYEMYSSKGVRFSLVYPDETLTKHDIAAHRKEYQLQPAGVLDGNRDLVKKSGATITPEAVVFDADGRIVYRGRIDDIYTSFGDRRKQPTEQNLRLALDAVLAGKEVAVKQTTAIGCLIEDL